MSNAPNSESFAELVRQPYPASQPARRVRAQKMIVALARESGVIAENYDNFTGAEAIRTIFNDVDVPPLKQAVAAATTLPPLPPALHGPEKAQPVTKDRFAPRTLDQTQSQRVIAMRAAFEAVEQVVLHLTAPGRLQSLVLTALEEGCMWGVKAISHENG